MRRAAFVLLTVGLIIGLILWLRPADRPLEEMVPADLLGLVIINRVPDSFDFLSETRLGEWFNDGPALLQSSLAEQAEGEWFFALRESLDRACVMVHTLEKKENGAFRPHLTAFLWPVSGRETAVEDWIRTKVINRFGEDRTKIVKEDSVQVFRGETDGQILYLRHERGYLIISNSEVGWKDVQLTLAGRAPHLGEKESFKDIRSRISQDIDLFFYFSGAGTYPLLPEFGYGVRIEEEHVTDLYWEVP